MTVAIATVAIAVLLLIGYLTPVAGVLAALFCVSSAFSWFPISSPELFKDKLSAAFGAIIVASLVCLGPGAFSLDARLFGRREIIIPNISPSSKG
jgi:uncharacterized membrane protein YphA (DoxX/SURF4 family)